MAIANNAYRISPSQTLWNKIHVTFPKRPIIAKPSVKVCNKSTITHYMILNFHFTNGQELLTKELNANN